MQTDFSQGKVWRRILSQSVPLMLAQLIQLLYNIVDRVYIGHLPGTDSMALTGLGLTFPVVTLVSAFTNLFGMGGTPLFSIARGKGDEEEAGLVLGNATSLLCVSSAVLMVFCYLFRRPMLFLFGASEAAYVYADAYLVIYLIGTPFTMLASGLNGFINAQGFPRVGMMTVVLGAVLNLILDPLFIFVFRMGVAGAALATVISQGVSCLWVLRFLTGSRAVLRIRKRYLRVRASLAGRIAAIGASGFIMSATNCLVQVVCSATLHLWGGDLYVGLMTVINSVREILSMPVSGLTGGSQPVIGFNYGARRYSRVRSAIRFMTVLGAAYTVLSWALVLLLPRQIISVFTPDPALQEIGVPALHTYFFGFVFMALQFAGQSVFQGLGYARHAIFFSLLRKAVIVTPLTLLLPGWGLGVEGVFWAEPISNAIGGTLCYVTMLLTVYRRLPAADGAEPPHRV